MERLLNKDYEKNIIFVNYRSKFDTVMVCRICSHVEKICFLKAAKCML